MKKVFVNLIISSLFFTSVNAAESGGMPQLNPEFWLSQIFFLTITFGILYIVLAKLILPKISGNLEMRKAQILDNIETAEKQREESESKIKEYEKLIIECKNEAKALISETREKVNKDIAEKNDQIEKEIKEEIKKAELEINNLMKNAPEKINKIAIDTSNELIKGLVGAEVNQSSLSAIVEDLSSKNKGKHYGN